MWETDGSVYLALFFCWFFFVLFFLFSTSFFVFCIAAYLLSYCLKYTIPKSHLLFEH